MKSKLIIAFAMSLFSLSALALTGAACCSNGSNCCPGSCCRTSCRSQHFSCCPGECCNHK